MATVATLVVSVALLGPVLIRAAAAATGLAAAALRRDRAAGRGQHRHLRAPAVRRAELARARRRAGRVAVVRADLAGARRRHAGPGRPAGRPRRGPRRRRPAARPSPRRSGAPPASWPRPAVVHAHDAGRHRRRHLPGRRRRRRRPGPDPGPRRDQRHPRRAARGHGRGRRTDGAVEAPARGRSLHRLVRRRRPGAAAGGRDLPPRARLRALTLPRDVLVAHTLAGLDDAVFVTTAGPGAAAAVRDRAEPGSRPDAALLAAQRLPGRPGREPRPERVVQPDRHRGPARLRGDRGRQHARHVRARAGGASSRCCGCPGRPGCRCCAWCASSRCCCSGWPCSWARPSPPPP